MALIEYQFCTKHGKGNHSNGVCWKCSEDDQKLKNRVRVLAREKFIKLSTEEKLVKLYDMVSNT